ncbi:hypothetical protein ES708_28051 [subsurface metagenome]
MAALEYWVRLVRLPFVIGLAVAGYLVLLKVSTGWQHTFFFWMLLPFALATVILECMQLADARYKNKKH